jgi:hypothetical protein
VTFSYDTRITVGARKGGIRSKFSANAAGDLTSDAYDVSGPTARSGCSARGCASTPGEGKLLGHAGG